MHDEDTLRATYEHLDAVFLIGGVDVDPTVYGEERHEMCDRADPARDWVEITLVRWCLQDRKPILGVCRGIQVINVACGGKLYQHLPDQKPEAIKHDYFPSASHYTRDYLAHEVTVDPKTRLGQLLGQERVKVNSMHHQGIKSLAPSLRPTAFAPDGLIEGVESTTDSYLVAVQWHPEELADAHESQRRLFTDFISAASGESRA
jgi:putative glutamine amidotransferase